MRYLRLFGFLALIALPLLGVSCGRVQAPVEQVTLKIWRVWDEEDVFEDTLKAYRTLHPNVKFEYKKLRFEEFQDELLSAWARGEGPDIFSIPNYQVGEFQDFIEPLPAQLEIPKLVTKKILGFKEETTQVFEKVRTYTTNDINSMFVPVVADDVIFPDQEEIKQIYGLPLAIDNLALYYNRDILDQAGIPLPPKTWKDLLVQVPKLVKESGSSEVIQSGIALGTVGNLTRYMDLLSLLMIQDGTPMAEPGAIPFTATFDTQIKDAEGQRFHPGSHALTFFTDFANPAKQAYSWNEDLPDAFEAFTQGQLAYFVGYSYHAPMIETAAPRLNYDVAALPQVNLNQSANYANYWVETVYTNSPHADWAWDVVTFMTKKENVTSYLNATKRPSALREIVALQSEQDPDIKAFVDQALTSTSWYHGKDYAKVEEAFKNMIDDVNQKRASALDAVAAAENMINQNEELKSE